MTSRIYSALRTVDSIWFRQLPAHWHCNPIKFCARLVTKSALAKSRPIALENIEGWTGKLIETATLFEGDGIAFESGDLLFGKLRPYLAKVYRADAPGEAVGDFFVLRPDARLDSRFLQYALLAKDLIVAVNVSTYGSKMPRVGWEFMRDVAVPMPPKGEQLSVVAFLDRETTRIDALIKKKSRFIELLREKRQALVTRAVSGGLGPTVPMNESGVEWLGKVPSHWQVKPLKLLVKPGTSVTYGIVQPGDALTKGVPFVQTTNMTKGDFDLDRLQRTTPEIEAGYPRSRLVGGEVILGIRASIGAAHIVPPELNGANLSRGVARIDCNEMLSPGYFLQYLRSHCVQSYWELARQGSTFNEVSIDTVRQLPVPVPPIDEQVAITSTIAARTNVLDRIVTASKASLVLLTERRAALITAVVTGQIDVRAEQSSASLEPA